VHSVTLDETGPDGEPNVIWVVATDEAGNVASVAVHVLMDTVAPSIILDGLDPATRKESVVFAGRLENAGDLATMTVNGVHMAVADNGTFSGLVLLDEGPNTLVVRAVDRAGNEAMQVRSVERLPEVGGEDTESGLWAIPLVTFVVALLLTFLIGRSGILRREGR
jgi:hypothetical protein